MGDSEPEYSCKQYTYKRRVYLCFTANSSVKTFLVIIDSLSINYIKSRGVTGEDLGVL